MSPSFRYPGVYIEEVPSGVRTIVGMPTAIAAFVGRAWKGPLDEPIALASFGEFERVFGGLWHASSLAYAVRQFFENGGSQALIVRAAHHASAASLDLGGGTLLDAASAGTWGRNLVASVTHAAGGATFDLELFDDPTRKRDSARRGGSGAREKLTGLSCDAANAKHVANALARQSQLARARTVGATRPPARTTAATAASGHNGESLSAADLVGAAQELRDRGLYALRKADVFNLLCIPPLTLTKIDNGLQVWRAAARLCVERRAMLLVDAPANWSVSDASAGIASFRALERANAALYFPRLRAADPLSGNALAEFAPCGAIAGLIARTDATRGVWKAPAGIEARLQGVADLALADVSDADNGELNRNGINCLRHFAAHGNVVWGARTLDGADEFASEWKYVPVRRLALHIEESLFRGMQWAVFEPNDERLWQQLRLTVGAFLHPIFQGGAFQGDTPRDAYFVKCDTETTTQSDIDNGRVNVLVGFAPLKPAEFVVLRFQVRAASAAS